MQLVKTQYLQRKAIGLLTGQPSDDTTRLTTGLCKLYTTGPSPTPQSQLSDFTIADFTGYADTSPTWQAILNEADGSASALSDVQTFEGTGTTTLNTIAGMLLCGDGSASAKLVAACQFTNPIPITGPFSGFGLTIVLNSGSESVNDECNVIV